MKLSTLLPLVDFLLQKANTLHQQESEVERMNATDSCGMPSLGLSTSQWMWSSHEYMILKLVIMSFTPKMSSLLLVDSDPLQTLLKLLDCEHFYSGVISPQELALRQV